MIYKSLLSLFLIASAGFFARKTGLLKKEEAPVLNVFLYYFALPALFFSKILKIEISSLTLKLFLGSLLPLLLILAVLLILMFSRVIGKDLFILFSLSIVFGSNAFFGIPFFEVLMGEQGLDWAIFSAAVLGLFGVLASTILFEYAIHQHHGPGFLLKLFLSPLVIGIFSGVVFRLLNFEITFLFNAVKLLGASAPPLAIFALGMFVFDHFSAESIRKSLPYFGFRALVLPLATGVVLHFLGGMPHSLAFFLFLQSGIPSAVALFVLATRYQYKVAEISGMVMLSSLAAFVILPALSFFSGRLF